MLYDIVQVDLEVDLQPKLKPFDNTIREVSLVDKLFDQAADVEAEQEKYDSQQQNPPGESCSKGCGKSNFWLAMS